MSARDFCAKLRTEDLNASNATRAAHVETLQAATAMRCIPQVFEEDALIVLHTLQCQIERNGNQHLQIWQDTCELLTDLQALLQRSIDASHTVERPVVRPLRSVA